MNHNLVRVVLAAALISCSATIRSQETGQVPSRNNDPIVQRLLSEARATQLVWMQVDSAPVAAAMAPFGRLQDFRSLRKCGPRRVERELCQDTSGRCGAVPGCHVLDSRTGPIVCIGSIDRARDAREESREACGLRAPAVGPPSHAGLRKGRHGVVDSTPSCRSSRDQTKSDADARAFSSIEKIARATRTATGCSAR